MAHAQGEHRQDTLRLFVSACAVAAFVCALFAAAASMVVAFLYFSGSLDETPRFGLKIDAKAVMFLLGTEMDFQSTTLKSGFVFNNPNQISACGCGESVQLKEAEATQ